jgi:adenosyl cobinamide kinase/adenosyl cobinamide phosphate guanylyltransferase
MRIHLVTGGARSGKSRYAEKLASKLGGEDVTYLATAQALDEEMAQRIEKHKTHRPATWRTFEAPRDIAGVLRSIQSRVVLLDCLTLLASNVFMAAASFGAATDGLADEIGGLFKAAAERDGDLIIVTNEIGSGIVPDNAVARAFGDALGEINQRIARNADSVTLLVSGLPVSLKLIEEH